MAVVLGVGVFLAAGTTMVAIETLNPPEPTYRGRSLSTWTKAFFKRTKNGYQISRGGLAADAIKHMGKDALPTLLRMVSADKSYLGIPTPDVSMQAVGGFWALGPVAEETIPELTLLVNQSQHAWAASLSLAGISPKAVDPLIQALKNPNTTIRVFAANALGKGFQAYPLDASTVVHPPLGTNATAAIAALVQCTRDSETAVRTVAITALGSINREPEVVIPTLVNILGDRDPQCRRMAVQAIGLYGKEARLAIPSLKASTKDPDDYVQALAKEALQSIEREVSVAGK